jgi:hypothetical protein
MLLKQVGDPGDLEAYVETARKAGSFFAKK